MTSSEGGEAVESEAGSPLLALEAGDAATCAGAMVRGGEEFDTVPVRYKAGALAGAMISTGSEYDLAY